MQRALLLSLVAASYLLLAGGPRWTLPGLLVLAVLGVLVAPRRTLAFPPATRSLDVALIAITAAIAGQLLPLPVVVVDVLSPNAARLAAATQFAVGTPAPWLTLSIDAEATAYALGTVILASLAFWIARATFGAGGYTRHFFRALGLFGALASVVALVQKAVAPGLLMGLVTPAMRSGNPLGPFLNRNHFAARALELLAQPWASISRRGCGS